MSNYRIYMKTILSLIPLSGFSLLFSQTKSKEASGDSEILNIGSRLEIFADDFLIHELINMRFVMEDADLNSLQFK